MKEIILAGGCYWAVEAIFKKFSGFSQIKPGYYNLDKAHYGFTDNDQVEVVYLKYNENFIDLDKIFKIFFFTHNPSLLKWDIEECFYPKGRSAIIYLDQEHKEAAQNYMKNLFNAETFDEKIHTIDTKIIEGNTKNFISAPDKEINYFEKYPKDGYCTSIIEPKIEKLKEVFDKF